MGRPITCPGIIGALALSWPGGLEAVSEETGTPVRTLRAWANNEREPGAIAASRLRDLCEARSVVPLVYRTKEAASLYLVASLPEGWVRFYPLHWHQRERFPGSPLELIGQPGLDAEQIRRDSIAERALKLRGFEAIKGGGG